LDREEKLIYQDGSTHWVVVTKLPRRNNRGEIIGTMGIARDVTLHREAELALKESERRISLLMSNLPGMVYRCLLDENWTMIFVNDGVKALTGYDADDIINNKGIAYEELIYPDDQARVRIVVNQAIHRGIPFELTYRIITREGKEKWVRERGRHAEMQGDGLEIIDGFITDITQQKLADDRLRESEERFRLIFMTSPDPVSISRMEDSRFVDVNTGMLELFGYSRHEFIGHTASELNLWQNNSDRLKMLENLEAEKRILNLEVRLRNNEGETIIALMSANLIQLHGEQHTITIVRDITALKMAEEALRQSEARYHSLYQSMNEIFMLCELIYQDNQPVDYRVLDLNEAFSRHFEISREDAVNHSRSELFGPVSSEILTKYQQLIKNGEPIQYEYYFENLSRWYNVSAFTPEPGRFALLMSDITEKKRIGEELQRAQKLESIGLLAGGIAHDFNNRLAAILGNAQLAQLYVQKDSQINTYLGAIVKGAQQATHLTKQLLTFSRGGNPVKKVHKVEDLIRDAIEISLSGSKQRCHTDIPTDLWNTKVDGGQIIQIFNNIIINADQAMPEGGLISIKAQNFHQTTDGDALNLGEAKYIRVEISDTGMGIPQSIIGKIFDPFFTTKKNDTGLGLATCYSIIKKHGGDIRVESQPDKGTSFFIYLPAAAQEISYDSDEEQLAKGSGRVLIMDDDKMIVNMLILLLKSLGYSAEGTMCGEEAIKLCKQHLGSQSAFQIAILDLTVTGGMGGEETVGHLKALDPNIKALVSSGYSTDPIMSNYKQYGFDGVIPKPYTKASLSQALVKVLVK
jgi:two-component system, cell cycle sensor histidine kinase and response regulator CckA